MPQLDRRAAGLGFGSMALAWLAGRSRLFAQDAGTKTAELKIAKAAAQVEFVTPPMDLRPHCAIIRRAFNYINIDTNGKDYPDAMNGEPRAAMDRWIAGGCVGDVPVPRPGDPHNIQRFNAAGRILRTSSLQIAIHPNHVAAPGG
jgi:hypothetical protein